MEKSKEVKAYLKLQRKLFVLEYAKASHSVAKALKEFKIPKATYYKWKKIYDKDGADGLLKKHPVAYNHPNKIKEEVIEKVLFLRKEYGLGSWRIKWYLERYHGITISEPECFEEYSNATVSNGCRRRQREGLCTRNGTTNRSLAIMYKWI